MGLELSVTESHEGMSTAGTDLLTAHNCGVCRGEEGGNQHLKMHKQTVSLSQARDYIQQASHNWHQKSLSKRVFDAVLKHKS